MQGRVYIVGAGPGDPELITLKAHHLLQKADIVFYDRLVDEALINKLPKKCRKVFVGKGEGESVAAQERINKLLADASRQFKKVVRLKGGDPFIFGRGGEEMQYLAEKKIPFEMIPGITSAIAIPGLEGIPLTHRALSSSFAVLTGHLADENHKSLPWKALTQIDTLVFLMAVKHKKTIAKKLIQNGRDPNETTVFIQNGSTPDKKLFFSSLKKMALNPPQVKPPAVFVVGKVVGLLHKEFGKKSKVV